MIDPAISVRQRVRLESLGATFVGDAITATEEQLWRAGIIGKTRALLDKRGLLTVGTSGPITVNPGINFYELSGAALTAAINPAGCVMIMDMTLLDVAAGGYGQIEFYDDPDAFNTDLSATYGVDPGNTPRSQLMVNGSVTGVTSLGGVGAHKMAIRLTTTTLSASVDGLAVATAPVVLSPPIAGVVLTFLNLSIDLLSIYPVGAFADAALPALSAL